MPIGLTAATRRLLGFGIAFLDVDNDGWLDVLTANGHIVDGRPRYPWKMPLQLMLGGPGGRLSDVSESSGPPFQPLHLGRGSPPATSTTTGGTTLWCSPRTSR